MRTVPVLALVLAVTASAAAQSTTDSVTVNSPGAQVLIDPGTGQERVVPTLLQPWQVEPVRLHPPHAHRASAAAAPEPSVAPVAAAAPPPAVATIAKPPRAPRVASAPKPLRAASEPAPQPVRKPAAAPVQQASQPAASTATLDEIMSQQPAPPPPPQKTASVPPPPPKPAAVEEPKPAKPATRTANLERNNPATTAGKRRDSITFTAGATDPSSAAVNAMRSLATSLSAALTDSGSRIQLLAYAGAKGEKSSDTRRLSLKRALVVRQLLIDDGVPSERIDVFALGGVEDDGPLDRVDVYVKG